jgi:hypothetical protein
VTDEIDAQPPANASTPPPAIATGTAAEKIQRTLRLLSKPEADAGAMEMTLASVAMGLEGTVGENLGELQAAGDVDEFILALTRWIASHRSDTVDALVVVELPARAMKVQDLPAGIGLQRLQAAIDAQLVASSPL